MMPRWIILRLIESISSPKAEPFKFWLAKMENDRIDDNKTLKNTSKKKLKENINTEESNE